MQSIEKQIEKSIKGKPKGTLVFPDDFLGYGSSEAIRKALDRLENKKDYNSGRARNICHAKREQVYWPGIAHSRRNS